MAILTKQVPTRAGTTFTKVAAASGGDSFANTGVEYFHITNAHATNPRTVTFDSPGTCNFELANNAAHDLAVVVSALQTKIIGPFPVPRFNDTNGRVQVTYSDAAADLTVAVEALT